MCSFIADVLSEQLLAQPKYPLGEKPQLKTMLQFDRNILGSLVVGQTNDFYKIRIAYYKLHASGWCKPKPDVHKDGSDAIDDDDDKR